LNYSLTAHRRDDTLVFEGFGGYGKKNRRNEGGVKLPERPVSPSLWPMPLV
jgi:hypothetical protein